MVYKLADLILVRGTGPVSHEIEEVTDSPYSHVAGIVKPNELVEAQAFRKTGYAPEDVYDGACDVYTCDTLTDDQRERIVKFVLGKIGTGYNYELLGWEYVHYRLHIDLPLHEDGEYDCSELWRQAYLSVGVELCPNVEYASPGDVANSHLLRKY